MNEIKLSVDDKNLATVLSILNNLKSGLITNIETSAKVGKVKASQYQPKIKQGVSEDDFGTTDKSGKYINPALYKQRLQNKK